MRNLNVFPYQIDQTCMLGHGTDGTVYKGVNKFVKLLNDGNKVAIKKIQFNYNVGIMPHVLREIAFLGKANTNKSNNSYVAKIIDMYIEESFVMIVLELCENNLMDMFINDNINEQDKNQIMCDIIRSINFVHSLGYVHGDLNLKNFVNTTSEGKKVLKLIDFTSTTKIYRYDPYSYKPTLYICPPELLGCSKTKISNPLSVDMWALGCLLYMIETGVPLFATNSEERQLQQTKSLFKKSGQLDRLKDSTIRKYIIEMLQPNQHKRGKCIRELYYKLTREPLKTIDKNINLDLDMGKNPLFEFNDQHKLVKFMCRFLDEHKNISKEVIFVTLKNINKLKKYNETIGIIIFWIAISVISNVHISILDVAQMINVFSGDLLNNRQIIDIQLKIIYDLHFDIDPETVYGNIVETYDVIKRELYVEIFVMCLMNREMSKINETLLTLLIGTIINVYYYQSIEELEKICEFPNIHKHVLTICSYLNNNNIGQQFNINFTKCFDMIMNQMLVYHN